MSLVADILQACAASPQPWYAAEFVHSRAESLEDILFCLNILCDEGILDVVRNEQLKRDAFVLTQRGAELVRHPEAIDRFVKEQALDLSQQNPAQAREIHRLYFQRPRWPITKLLLLLNFLVFGLGWMLAREKNIAGDYLMPIKLGPRGVAQVVQNPQVYMEVMNQVGLLSRESLLAGEWWRLLGSGFAHLGLIHLGMNMFVLWRLGRPCEWFWGSWRYLIIYLLAILGGGCLAMTKPNPVAGASGAICGLLGAMAVWTIVYRKYQPRRLVRRNMRAMFINLILMTAISLAPGVSGEGHLGGALAGGAAALLLHWHRFGGPLLRPLALLGLIVLPIGCVGGLRWTMQHNAEWLELRGSLEVRRINRLDNAMLDVQADAEALRTNALLPLLRRQPDRRPAEQVQHIIERLDGLLSTFTALKDRAAQAQPFQNEAYEESRQAIIALSQAQVEYLTPMREALAKATPWQTQQRELKQVQDAFKRWRAARKQLAQEAQE